MESLLVDSEWYLIGAVAAYTLVVWAQTLMARHRTQDLA